MLFRRKKIKDEQPFDVQNGRGKIGVFRVTDFHPLPVRVLFVAHRPDDIQTTGPVAEPVHQRIQKVPAEEVAQPSRGVRVPGGGVLRIFGQVAGLGVVHGSARRQLLPQRKR